eukprot:GHVR01135516.1.p1 GENE.GHVR01135516.1~~GHVR01135516.1.p1  ORF type:complete len:216 (-),score=34.39 GHVR01135516.1:499-1146(-)
MVLEQGCRSRSTLSGERQKDLATSMRPLASLSTRTLPLCMTLTCMYHRPTQSTNRRHLHRPAPQMVLDGGGAAIAIRDLGVWAGSSELIEPFDWRIMPRERWSLLGPNGCGKSTLLRSISGAAVDAASGVTSSNIYVNPKQRFGMLEQTAVSGSGMSVRDEVMSRMAPYQRAKKALEVAEAACITGSECELEALDRATSEFEAVGGYSIEKRVIH